MIENNVCVVLVVMINHYRHLHLLHISCLTTLPYPRCITQTCASPRSILNHILLIQARSSFKESRPQSHPPKNLLIQGSQEGYICRSSLSILNHILLIQGRSSFKALIKSQSFALLLILLFKEISP